MSAQGGERAFDWESITYARARLLRELADGRTEREIGERMQVTSRVGLTDPLSGLKRP